MNNNAGSYTLDELLAERERRKKANRPKRKEATFNRGLLQGGAERLTGGLLDTADFALKGARGGSNVIRGLLGQEMQPVPEGGFLPSGREALAALQVGAENLIGGEEGPSGQRVMDIVQGRDQIQEDAPFGHGLGEFLADGATLLTARRPIRDSVRQSKHVAKKIDSDFWDDKVVAMRENARDVFGRGVGKAFETGLEAGALAIMNEADDPAQIAALGAGAQGGASLMLQLTEGITKKGVLPVFAGLVMAHQLWKAVGPDQRNWFDSSDEAINQLVTAYGVGALMTAAGGARIPKGAIRREGVDAMLDTMNTGLRAGLLSSVIRYMDAEKEQEEPVTPWIMENFQDLPEKFQDKIQKGYELDKFGETIDELKQDEEFQELLRHGAKLGSIPVKDEDE